MSNDTSAAPAPRSRVPVALAGTAVVLALAAMAVPIDRSAPDGAQERVSTSTFAASVAPGTFLCGARLASDGRVADGGARPEPVALAPRLEALRAALYEPDRFERRSGEGERIECRGAKPPHPVTWRFDLEQLERVRTLDGTVALNAFESRHTVIAPRDARLVDGTLVAETVSLPDIDAWLPDPGGDGLVAGRSARRAGERTCTGAVNRRCSVTLDTGWRLRAAGGSIAIERTIWIGGLAAGHVVWRLDA